MRRLRRLASLALSAADGEFLLHWMPNSGGVVVARAAWLSTLLLLLYVAVMERLAPGASWDFCGECLVREVRENLSLGGAIFAASYAALYARFSSQWLYLAGLYNQIMDAQVRAGDEATSDPVRAEKIALWKAGFIEDAVAVHLARKPMYAAVIVGMLADARVRSAYAATTKDGARELVALESALHAILGPVAVAQLTARSTVTPLQSGNADDETAS